ASGVWHMSCCGDWSSDVCSSDLELVSHLLARGGEAVAHLPTHDDELGLDQRESSVHVSTKALEFVAELTNLAAKFLAQSTDLAEIGRASERVAWRPWRMEEGHDK